MALKDRLKKISDNSNQADVIRLAEFKMELNDIVLEKINSFNSWNNFDRKQQMDLISKFTDAKIKETGLNITARDIEKFKQQVFDDVFKLSLLKNFFINKDCKKILVKGFDLFLLNDKPVKSVFRNEKHFINTIYQILIANNQIDSVQSINKFFFKFQINNEFVLTIILPPKSDEPVLCIEKTDNFNSTFEDLINENVLTKMQTDLIKDFIKNGKSIIIKTDEERILPAILNEMIDLTLLFEDVITVDIQKPNLIKMQKPIKNLSNLGVKIFIVNHCGDGELTELSRWGVQFIAISPKNLKTEVETLEI